MKKTLIVTQVCDIRVKEALLVSIKQIDTSVLPVPGNECKWYWSQVQFRSYVVCLYSPCWPVFVTTVSVLSVYVCNYLRIKLTDKHECEVCLHWIWSGHVTILDSRCWLFFISGYISLYPSSVKVCLDYLSTKFK